MCDTTRKKGEGSWRGGGILHVDGLAWPGQGTAQVRGGALETLGFIEAPAPSLQLDFPAVVAGLADKVAVVAARPDTGRRRR